MPGQVNEVVVRTTVDTKTPCEPDKAADSGAKGAEAEIIERVLEILREKKER